MRLVHHRPTGPDPADMRITYEWHSTPQLWLCYDAETYDGAPDSATRGQYGTGKTKEEALADFLDWIEP